MSVTQGFRLGPSESKLLFGLEAKAVDLFTVGDARRILGGPRSAAVDVLHQLRRKGRVAHVRKGAYLLVPARAGIEGSWAESIFRVIDGIVDPPYYVGFWTALNYWGMSPQIPRTVHVVHLRRRRPFEYQGQRVRYVRLRPDLLFGWSDEPLPRGSFRISDPEKTVLDGLLLPRHCGGVGEVARAIRTSAEEIRWTRMESYVRRMHVDAVRRRLGFVLEMTDLAPSLRKRLARDFSGFRWLDPSGASSRYGYSMEWGLILNVDPVEIRSWRSA